MRPRAAATNSDRAGSARPSAPASRTAVSWRAVRLMPRSRSLTDRGLTPAALASSCCVSRASARSCRSNPANPEVACSAMTAASPPPALSPPAATSTAREGPVPKIIQARRPRHQSRHRPARSPGPQRPPGTGAPALATGAVLPACPVHAARRRHPVGLLCAARVRITPGHGHTRTNASPSGPACTAPGQNRSSDPCPCAYPGGEALMGARIPEEQGAMAESAAARSSAPAGVPNPASRPGKQA